MWRGFQFFMFILNLAVIATLVFLAWNSGWTFDKGSSSIEYKDFVSILLTALGVMVTILGLFLAALAIYGFEAIRQEARAIAKNEAARVAKETAQPVARGVAQSVAARSTQVVQRQSSPEKADGIDYGEVAGEDVKE